jgi:hypothetical protein
MSRIYFCLLSGSAYGPTEVTPLLLARREHSCIGLYRHGHQGLSSNGPRKRSRPRICECAQLIILSDFRAFTQPHARVKTLGGSQRRIPRSRRRALRQIEYIETRHRPCQGWKLAAEAWRIGMDITNVEIREKLPHADSTYFPGCKTPRRSRKKWTSRTKTFRCAAGRMHRASWWGKFCASDRRDPLRLGPRTDRERPGR